MNEAKKDEPNEREEEVEIGGQFGLFAGICISLITQCFLLLLVYNIGIVTGKEIASPTHITSPEKITKLHTYMHDKTVLWAWRQAYCNKQAVN